MPHPARQVSGGLRAPGRLTIGRIWGIPISVHVSWLLVFALVAGSLAGGYFPSLHPEWGTTTRWVLGALTSLAFFACILVHELGHSRVAVRNGIPIRGITLFVFGGVAQISREAASPGVEFRIAIAGPLTSLGLAALLAGIGTAAGGVAVAAVPDGAGAQPAQGTEAVIGPYELQDFHLYYTLRFGYPPSKVAFLAYCCWHDLVKGAWPDIAAGRRHEYGIGESKAWLRIFLDRFFGLSQFKRSCMPNGPKVGSGGSLSPRGDYRAPSDSEATVWLRQLDLIPE